MTIKGAKRNVPHLLQAQQAPVVNIGNAPVPKVPRQGMLEFEGPMGQCFSRFPTVSNRKRGKKRRKIRD